MHIKFNLYVLRLLKKNKVFGIFINMRVFKNNIFFLRQQVNEKATKTISYNLPYILGEGINHFIAKV